MNVFPVSDSDTGTNLQLTLAGIASAVPEVEPRTSLDAIVQAAILSAHGNSGAIVAEMFTSVAAPAGAAAGRLRPAPAGALVAVLLRTVADRGPAGGGPTGRRHHPHRGRGGGRRGRGRRWPTIRTTPWPSPRRPSAAAREALARTPEQLAVLAAAGVVDAGGQAYVLLLDVLVEVLGGEPAAAAGRRGDRRRSRRRRHRAGHRWSTR